ncbi:glycosyltransferase [Aestuariispira insulae]|uniref:Glycosyltransferase involved in cell wall biosynthesis n=1 Tax=Aestuariispira insulae TaxID=1461337 RepID=A0A3D9H3L1_9PROT|nr:glycosyltransferase [Aestuariispira insulae]RED43791.1 glycosyltransferase involved in cell wall biosynthesis [Aestuariispira insulae]
MKNTGKTPLVVFGEDWASHPSSTQHLIRKLMHEHPVIWVNSIGLRRPRISWRDINRLFTKLFQILRGKGKAADATDRTTDKPLEIIHPIALPLPGNRLASWFNARSLSRQVKQTLAKHGLANPVLWLSLPTAVDVVGRCGESATLYYAGDDFSALAGVDHDAVIPMEQSLAAKAQAIVAPSPVIADRFPRDNTFIIPHGCDHSLFSTPQPKAKELKDGKPIAGFYGSLDEWLDQDLLIWLARSLPDWKFQFIGPIKTDLGALLSLGNVEFLGVREHHQLPSYVQHWSASLIPFRDTRQIRACNPLKLREYLAAGTPIVSTAFPAVQKYSDHVAICNDRENFRTALQDCLIDEPVDRSARQNRVRSESWEARAHDMQVLIEALHFASLTQNAAMESSTPDKNCSFSNG